MNINKQYIEEFVSKIKEKYTDLVIDYDYNTETEEYDIWHNSSTFQFESEPFLEYVGNLMIELLYSNDIYNFSFGYDFFKCTMPKKEYNIYMDTTWTSQSISVNSACVMNHSSFFSFNSHIDQTAFLKIEPRVSFNAQHDRISKFIAQPCEVDLIEKLEQVIFFEDTNVEERLAA